MKPTVGRIVHYIRPTEHGHAGKHRAAMIVGLPSSSDDGATDSTTVDLAVFGDGRSEPAIENILNVAQDPEGKINGTFHEPERDAPPPAQT